MITLPPPIFNLTGLKDVDATTIANNRVAVWDSSLGVSGKMKFVPLSTTGLLAAIATSGSASDLIAGTVPIARIGSSGTPSSTTFHRGDNVWATIDLSPYITTAAVAAGYQPLDSDLTSIAALTTTAFGRSALTWANAAAGQSALALGSLALVTPTGTPNGAKFLRDDYVWTTVDLSSYATTAAVAAGYQPLDSDLTSIAALTTTSFGRGLLTLGTGTTAQFLRGDGAFSNTLTGDFLTSGGSFKATNTTAAGATISIGPQSDYANSPKIGLANSSIRDSTGINIWGNYFEFVNTLGNGFKWTSSIGIPSALLLTTSSPTLYPGADLGTALGTGSFRFASLFIGPSGLSFGTSKGSITLSADSTAGNVVVTSSTTGKIQLATSGGNAVEILSAGGGGTGGISIGGVGDNYSTTIRPIQTGAAYYVGLEGVAGGIRIFNDRITYNPSAPIRAWNTSLDAMIFQALTSQTSNYIVGLDSAGTTNLFSVGIGNIVSKYGIFHGGTWFTGGSATTTKPHVLIEPAGTTSTSWSTSGTGFGLNAATGFVGNFADWKINDNTKFKFMSTGEFRLTSTMNATSTTYSGIRLMEGGGQNQLTFSSSGADFLHFDYWNNVIRPDADIAVGLGRSGWRFSQGFFGPAGLRIGSGTAGPTITATDATSTAIATFTAATGLATTAVGFNFTGAVSQFLGATVAIPTSGAYDGNPLIVNSSHASGGNQKTGILFQAGLGYQARISFNQNSGSGTGSLKFATNYGYALIEVLEIQGYGLDAGTDATQYLGLAKRFVTLGLSNGIYFNLSASTTKGAIVKSADTTAGAIQFIGGSTATTLFDFQTNGGTSLFKISSTAVTIGTNGVSRKFVRHGTATLVAGTVTVSDANVTANTIILLTAQNNGGTIGSLSITARTANTSFVITSMNVLDTSLVGYEMIEP